MEKSFNIIEQFALKIGNVKKKAQRENSEILKPFNLSGMHSMFINLLHFKGAKTLKEISDCLKCDKAFITRVVKDLEAKGLIQNDKQDEKQRKFKVFLTKEGEEIAQKTTAAAKERYEQIAKRLDENEWQTLFSLLDRLTE